MSAREVDEYLRGVEEPKRSTLAQPRRTILEIVPEASALHFPVDRPPPKSLVEKLIGVRLEQLRR